MAEKIIKFVGDFNNWMDFRDLLIQSLEECDTELKFNIILENLLISVAPNPKAINELRKKAGIPLLSKKEIKDLEKFWEENEK